MAITVFCCGAFGKRSKAAHLGIVLSGSRQSFVGPPSCAVTDVFHVFAHCLHYVLLQQWHVDEHARFGDLQANESAGWAGGELSTIC